MSEYFGEGLKIKNGDSLRFSEISSNRKGKELKDIVLAQNITQESNDRDVLRAKQFVLGIGKMQTNQVNGQTYGISQEKLVEIKETIKTKYDELYPLYIYENKQGGFIQDPSQKKQIVSEGQAYWMILSSRLAGIDSINAQKYQKRFDLLLRGLNEMIELAKKSGNKGDFPAWKVKVNFAGEVVLDRDDYGLTNNSAADADLDFIRALICAQELVEKGVWEDKRYHQLLSEFIPKAQANLFYQEQNTIFMKPSEDWNLFFFSDYLNPAACMEIAQYVKKKNLGDTIFDFFQKAATDSFEQYKLVYKTFEEFPSKIKFVADNKEISVERVYGTVQSFDGIRAPWKLGNYLKLFGATKSDIELVREIVASANKREFKYTNSPELDNSMYLPLAILVEDKDILVKLINNIQTDSLNNSRYFENTLYLLGLIDSFFK